MRLMKKLFIFPFATILLTAIMSLNVFADDGIYVYDETGYMITDSEWYDLNATAQRLRDTYEIGTYLVILEDYEVWGMGDLRSVGQYIYNNNDFGIGETKDGIMLIMSMAERDYELMVHGDYGLYVFSDYAMDNVEDAFLSYFRDDDFGNGFIAYFSKSEELMHMAYNGEPLSITTNGKYRVLSVVFSIVIAFLITALVVFIMTRGMVSVRKKTEAGAYVDRANSKITHRSDIFTHMTTTRHKVNTNNGGGSSGGFRSHGGKF
ncbi:MAG: TPM domain-containing protein [Lachnospiraceae bacterium]|nr:TPM domain-containing protein [Lachnospiraceae bacterium]